MEKTPDVHHVYRIEVKVPRVVPRPGHETTWRTLVPPDRIENTMQTADYLRSSLVASGLFDDDLVDEWFASNVRMIEYRITRDRTEELPVRVTEDGVVRPHRGS